MPNCTVEFPAEPIILGELGRRVIEATFKLVGKYPKTGKHLETI